MTSSSPWRPRSSQDRVGYLFLQEQEAAAPVRRSMKAEVTTSSTTGSAVKSTSPSRETAGLGNEGHDRARERAVDGERSCGRSVRWATPASAGGRTPASPEGPPQRHGQVPSGATPGRMQQPDEACGDEASAPPASASHSTSGRRVVTCPAKDGPAGDRGSRRQRSRPCREALAPPHWDQAGDPRTSCQQACSTIGSRQKSTASRRSTIASGLFQPPRTSSP